MKIYIFPVTDPTGIVALKMLPLNVWVPAPTPPTIAAVKRMMFPEIDKFAVPPPPTLSTLLVPPILFPKNTVPAPPMVTVLPPSAHDQVSHPTQQLSQCPGKISQPVNKEYCIKRKTIMIK